MYALYLGKYKNLSNSVVNGVVVFTDYTLEYSNDHIFIRVLMIQCTIRCEPDKGNILKENLVWSNLEIWVSLTIDIYIYF